MRTKLLQYGVRMQKAIEDYLLIISQEDQHQSTIFSAKHELMLSAYYWNLEHAKKK